MKNFKRQILKVFVEVLISDRCYGFFTVNNQVFLFEVFFGIPINMLNFSNFELIGSRDNGVVRINIFDKNGGCVVVSYGDYEFFFKTLAMIAIKLFTSRMIYEKNLSGGVVYSGFELSNLISGGDVKIVSMHLLECGLPQFIREKI